MAIFLIHFLSLSLSLTLSLSLALLLATESKIRSYRASCRTLFWGAFCSIPMVIFSSTLTYSRSMQVGACETNWNKWMRTWSRFPLLGTSKYTKPRLSTLFAPQAPIAKRTKRNKKINESETTILKRKKRKHRENNRHSFTVPFDNFSFSFLDVSLLLRRCNFLVWLFVQLFACCFFRPLTRGLCLLFTSHDSSLLWLNIYAIVNYRTVLKWEITPHWELKQSLHRHNTHSHMMFTNGSHFSH